MGAKNIDVLNILRRLVIIKPWALSQACLNNVPNGCKLYACMVVNLQPSMIQSISYCQPKHFHLNL